MATVQRRWLTGNDAGDLHGVWKYGPRPDRFNHLADRQAVGSHVSELDWVEDRLMFRSGKATYELDPATGQYPAEGFGPPATFLFEANKTVQLHGHHIVENRMVTPDGERYEMAAACLISTACGLTATSSSPPMSARIPPRSGGLSRAVSLTAAE